jgi:hypothetical protein
MSTRTTQLERLEQRYERMRLLDQEIAFLLTQLPPEEAERLMREVAEGKEP